MAKSQSGSPVRGAEIPRFTRNRLSNFKRFAEGKRQCLARAEDSLHFVIARTAATKQSQNGQPDMRQA
jgi:hypothetical protein